MTGERGSRYGAPPTPRGADDIPSWGRFIFLIAIGSGFAFGAADQYLGSRIMAGGQFLLGPWATAISLMSAPWLILPFIFGCTQVRPRRAMLLGLTVTMAALGGYFVLMWSPLEGVSLSQSLPHLPTLLPTQRTNIIGGLVTGPLFGLLGQQWHVNRWWASAALVAGALCLEPFARWVAGQLSPPAIVWEVEVAAGALLALFFVVTASRRARALS